MTKNIDQWVWMPHKELLFIPARITPETNGNCTILKDNNGNKYKYETNKLHSLQIAALSNFTATMPDLTKLEDLSQPSILYALRQNYLNDNIYINIGTILVSINPFFMLPIYGESTMIKYFNDKTYLSELPHVYQSSMNCYQTVVRDKQNASLIISGESGSGKTMVTRSVLDFLCNITAQNNKQMDIKSIILGTNPILEAFGNAKTVRNNNSSRFGKWIDILLNNDQQTIIGCNIIDYLLEKIRVVHLEKNERNYHIFYQMLKSKDKNMFDKNKFLLNNKDLKSFFFLNQNECSFIAENIDDNKEFNACLNSMQTLKWKQRDIDSIFYVLSGILYLGNIKFNANERKNDEASIVDDIDNENLTNVAKLFSISDIDSINKALITKTMKTGKNTMTIPISKEQAIKSRDSFCMAIYDKLFKSIVKNVNKSLKRNLNFNNDDGNNNIFHIGILDIFGFEQFHKNLFEQFCINHGMLYIYIFIYFSMFNLFVLMYLKQQTKNYNINLIKIYLN